MKCFFLSLFLYLPALLLAQIPTEFAYKADSVYSIVVAEGTYTGHLDENAMRSGHGILYYDGGGTYDGEFRDDKPHGYGVLDFPSACYEGWFVDGKKSGKGAIYHTREFRYEGSFLNDKFDGYGIFYYADGGYSEGEWKNGLKHGKGILKFKGHCCEGEWENNRANGWGACYMDDGSWYEGFMLTVCSFMVHIIIQAEDVMKERSVIRAVMAFFAMQTAIAMKVDGKGMMWTDTA